MKKKVFQIIYAMWVISIIIITLYFCIINNPILWLDEKYSNEYFAPKIYISICFLSSYYTLTLLIIQLISFYIINNSYFAIYLIII